MQNDTDTELGELIPISVRRNGNPSRRKTNLEIKNSMSHESIKVRAHGYCQPDFCTFWGGPSWNCNGTRRNNVPIEQLIWAEDRISGTMVRRSDGRDY